MNGEAVIPKELAPIIIGMSGISDLEGEDAAVRESFKAIFDYLDENCPASPKMLLTSLKKGADLLGAEEILDRDGWEIVVPLPLSLAVYLTDLDDDTAARLRSFIQQSSDRKKLRLFTLDPLRPGAERQPVGSSLVQSPEPASQDRNEQYEQAGLFIAAHCAILITVMRSDPNADRAGATGRIVQYRLTGDLDSAARNIVRRSRVLVEPAPLDVAPVGPVWLIDLSSARPQGDPKSGALFKALLPSDQKNPRSHQLRKSLRLVDRLNEFNIRAQRIDQNNMRRIAGAPPNTAQRSAILHAQMNALSTIQIDINRKLRYSVCSLAALFCIAIFMFEAQLDLNKQWGVFGYIAALVLGMSIYKLAWARRWQPFAQDYRAVSEAFRVQIAWWNCGLVDSHHRVDRFYLRRTTGSLGIVREAIRHMIDAAVLLSCREQHCTEQVALGKHGNADCQQSKAAGQDIDGGLTWIKEQIGYFDDRLSKRRTWVSFIDATSWFLLVASLGPEVVVAVNSIRGDVVRPMVDKYLGQLQPGVAFIAIVAVIVLVFVLSAARWLLSRSAWRDRERRIFETPSVVVSSIAGLLLSIALYDCAALLGAQGASNSMLIIGGVSVASIAYAMQFVGDRLSWAGEMRGYQDALEVFLRARSALKEIDGSDLDVAEQAVLRKTIIEALGKEALRENEGWLRAHRERPLEPLPPV
jgi:hypothetical protein